MRSVLPYSLVTVEAGAKRLGVNRRTLLRLAERGEIRVVKLGRHEKYFVTMRDLLELERRRRKARKAA